MKMNDKTPEFWAAVLTGLKNAWPQILGALMAGLIAYGRLIYDGAISVSLRVRGQYTTSASVWPLVMVSRSGSNFTN